MIGHTPSDHRPYDQPEVRLAVALRAVSGYLMRLRTHHLKHHRYWGDEDEARSVGCAELLCPSWALLEKLAYAERASNRSRAVTTSSQSISSDVPKGVRAPPPFGFTCEGVSRLGMLNPAHFHFRVDSNRGTVRTVRDVCAEDRKRQRPIQRRAQQNREQHERWHVHWRSRSTQSSAQGQGCQRPGQPGPGTGGFFFLKKKRLAPRGSWRALATGF